MKKILCILVLLSSIIRAQTIPANRTTNWKKAGHAGTYPVNIQHLNILNFGGSGNGTTNNSPALVAAMNSLAGHAGLIEFPAGNFLFNSTINLRDSIIIRGAGPGSTTFTFNLNNAVGDCFTMWGGTVGTASPVQGGFAKNSKNVKIASTAGYSVGDYIEIRELNGSWNTNPVYWAEYSVGQILKIDSIKNSRLYFHENLRINFDSTLNAEVIKLNPLMSSGIECLKLVRTDGSAPNVNYGIDMYYAVNCWVSGVESDKMIGAHIIIYRSCHCLVTGCYLHDAYAYDGSSTHGYGIVLGGHACEIKVENNIIRHLRHAIMCKEGANGNVIGYNYCVDTYRSEFPNDYGADLMCHGHYPYANLFEGNMVQNIQLDQTYGPSGPWNTFFRNRADGYGILMSSGSVQSDSGNFVGNDITNTSPFKGNYTLTGSNHYQYGNRKQGTVTPAGTTNLSTASYYLTASPAWWTSAAAWPTIGEPYSLSGVTIPARDRYIAGSNLTVCNSRTYRLENENMTDNTFEEGGINIYPVPASDFININFNFDKSENLTLEIFDLNGKAILIQKVDLKNNHVNVKALSAGIYAYRILTDDKIISHGKFLKTAE
jgi:type IX secretion system substrate protein/pectate lyase-like protein